VLFFLFVPSPLTAQQPTATIAVLKGSVDVLSQGKPVTAAARGMVLSQADSLQLHDGANVVLELSDGSTLELGENTYITVAELTQDMQTGARKSLIKLLWGRIRSKLSQGHQAPGSSYEVQTPNALVGVKFSQPDSEVRYDPESQETTAIAYRYELILTELATGSTLFIAQGSSGIVGKSGLQFIDHLLQTSTPPSQPAETPSAETPSEAVQGVETTPQTPPSQGLSTTAIIGTGVVVAAGAGAIIAVNANSGNDKNASGGEPFAGTFVLEESLGPEIRRTTIFRLAQTGNEISGNRSETIVVEWCCTADGDGPVSGTADGNTAFLTIQRGAGYCFCAKVFEKVSAFSQAGISLAVSSAADLEGQRIVGASWDEEVLSGTATLSDDGRVLNYAGQDYLRQ